jgi:hypothetical protein
MGAHTRSGREFVFVEESAEEVAPAELLDAGRASACRTGSSVGRREVESSVWSLLVEVANVDAEDDFELTAAED